MLINNVKFSDYFEELNEESKEFSDACGNIATGIVAKQNTIVELIEDSGPFLINKDREKRSKGILILGKVLNSIPNNTLDTAQLQYLCSFCTDRLKDHHSIIPGVLGTILTITKFDNLPDGITIGLLTNLFQNVPCQSQQPIDRLTIYKIFSKLLQRKKNELLSMGPDFVYGVMSAVENERNPENLLFLFKWFPVFCKTVDLGHLTEDMFEIMACYFPVDFQPAAHKPDAISREDLANNLTPCLCAVKEFEKYCIPLALEKLSSSLRVAKVDSLHLLRSGSFTFSSTTFYDNSAEILATSQRIIFENTDTDLTAICLNTLTAIITKLSLCDSDKFTNILSNIYETLRGNLHPSAKLFPQSNRMLTSVASSCVIAAKYITVQLAPLLINAFNITETITHQVVLLETLTSYLKILLKFDKGIELKDVVELSGVPAFSLKASVNSQQVSLQAAGFNSLGVLANHLEDEVKVVVLANFKEILKTQQPELVQKAIRDCLKQFSVYYPQEIKQLLQEIVIRDLALLKNYFESLACLISCSDLTDLVLDIITSETISCIDNATIALRILAAILKNNPENKEIQSYVTRTCLVSKLVGWFLINIDNFNIESNQALFTDYSEVLKTVIGRESSENQRLLVEDLSTNVYNGFSKSKNSVYVVIFDGLLSRLRLDVVCKVLEGILEELVMLSLNESNYLRDVSVQLLANLINKCENETKLLDYLASIESICQDILNGGDFAKQLSVLNLFSWITKALVMRGHNKSNMWIMMLIDQLDKYVECADGFKIIMNDYVDSLSQNCYCQRRILYQQRFFSQVTSIFVTKYNADKPGYLAAFCYLLEHTPMKVFQLEYTKILPLIIACMQNCTNTEALTALLNILNILLTNKEEILLDSISAILPELLKMTTFKQSMKVRILALKCLNQYTTGFAIHKVVPFKADVVHTLAAPIDDKKRLVRTEAAMTRCKWFLLGVEL